ncbi:DUF3885 domain-containing protein [Bacillus cihuensis]|uniref:DUF3885 domain-containing protein n=1 Tax=Bacillus cihuensis TaxID=1208599 RepID=UPI0004064F27|nr:DUF3885 domain-containing protein [Bacillus cihuensis]
MNVREEYENYMDTYFPNINPFPFYVNKKSAWIRFELGIPGEWRISETNYLNTAYQKAKTLFDEIHSPNDEIFLLIVDYTVFNKRYKKTRIFDRYIKEKSLKRRLQIVESSCPDPDFDEERFTYSYIIKCKVSELYYLKLLRDLSYVDFMKQPPVNQSCFIINTNTSTIFHMYDDRGLDLLANHNDTIKHIYQKYSSWILDYDRKEIDEDFVMGLHGIEEEDAERNERIEKDEKLLLELEKKDIVLELPHKPIHMFEVVKEQVRNLLSHLNSMGYATLEDHSDVNSDSKLITCMKPCQLYQHQVSIQSRLMALIGKKYEAKYKGWSI